MMNNNGPTSNFVLNVIESLAGLVTRSPDLENLRQILEQLTGEQWRRVSRDTDSDSDSNPRSSPGVVSRRNESHGRSENRNARNQDSRPNRGGLLQNLGHRITEYFSPSGRQDSETNVSQNSEQNAVDDGSTSSRSPPSDGDGSPEETPCEDEEDSSSDDSTLFPKFRKIAGFRTGPLVPL
ncbi:hypothetical protein THAOC_28180 [Thalassiosira oceanica]|uniref:Uncharacterized protein n=1 Tax=Thalassiosira oceanica TaxID=159749 RepID=K0S0W4_THAOC|nr:hypothetical protein THAOC_28180 [Thalassiosira oceanica]|eukprot:EJK52532.1 hypothetical protein THAOC_28180 [Thalassiosira oceanica]